MANRAKRTNMYNHAFQMNANKWKKKILWYKGKIDICQSKINAYNRMLETETDPHLISAITKTKTMYENNKNKYIEERSNLVKNMPKRKKVRYISKKMKNKSRVTA